MGEEKCGGGASSSFEYSWVVAVVLCVLSAVLTNLGTNVQKLAWNLRKEKRDEEAAAYASAASVSNNGRDGSVTDSPLGNLNNLLGTPSAASSIMSSPGDEYVSPRNEAKFRKIWYMGFAGITVGSIFDFAALGFGAQSVVAPLGSLTLVANMFFAQYFHKEIPSQMDILATGIIFIGCVLSVAFATHKNEICDIESLLALYQKPRFAIYGLTILVLLTCAYLSVRYIENVVSMYGKRSSKYQKVFRYHRFLYTFLSGVVGAQSVLFAKSLIELVVSSFTGNSRIFLAHIGSYGIFCGMFLSITLQIYFLNCALSLFDALYVVPVFQAQWIVFSVIGGGVFYGEFTGFDFSQGLAFLAGVVLTVIGVYVLSQREPQQLKVGARRRSRKRGRRSSLHTPLLDSGQKVKKYVVEKPKDYDVLFEETKIPISITPVLKMGRIPFKLWKVVTSENEDVKKGHCIVAINGRSVVGPDISPQVTLNRIRHGERPISIRFRTSESAEQPNVGSFEDADDFALLQYFDVNDNNTDEMEDENGNEYLDEAAGLVDMQMPPLQRSTSVQVGSLKGLHLNPFLELIHSWKESTPRAFERGGFEASENVAQAQVNESHGRESDNLQFQAIHRRIGSAPISSLDKENDELTGNNHVNDSMIVNLAE